MEFIYQFIWIIPFLPFLTSILIGSNLLFFPKSTKSLRYIWAILSIVVLFIAMIFSFTILWQQFTNNTIHQYLWSWIFNNQIDFKIGFLIDPLTSIMLVLITTVGVLVMIYSDSYMSHDQGYVRFFAYLSLFTASMLGLVLSPNLIQIYIFWELVGMCSYLLIGFWFTRPSAANACQKAFITNRIGDFGLLLGILGFYWITGSFEFETLFKRSNELLINNEVNLYFASLCALFLFLGPIAKSAQFPLHVWLPDAMEGPTPISALIHAATMVAAGIFLIARSYPLFQALPYIMNIISWVGAITALLGATIALAQKDLKKGLAYSTMSQLGYMMLALGIGSYQAGLFHSITHAYSKALLFLGSGSVIHSMESIVGYSPNKCQNMAFMGGLRKFMPITGITFLIGTFSICGIPPFACFWSKDAIITDSWLYFSGLGWISWITAGLTAFYMFRIYFLTFEGYLRANLNKGSFIFVSIWGDLQLNNKKLEFISKKLNNKFDKSFEIDEHKNKKEFLEKGKYLYPKESDNKMLFTLIILTLPTLFIGFLGAPFPQGQAGFDLLSQCLYPILKNSSEIMSGNWSEFLLNTINSLSIVIFGIFLAFILYGPISFFPQNLEKNFEFLLQKNLNPFISFIYNWSYFRGYIDFYYDIVFIKGTRLVAQFVSFFDEWIIDGIVNGFGILISSGGESTKYLEGGRISSYLFGLILGIFLLLSSAMS
uniref:NAD(P)H-quinone oxidoreductase subunit 5, chloroplastic n=1 Tax=Hygroamblystegium humile TaxID=2779698 RepID=A0A6M8NUZ9_9BRYO|nr:NADH-plastoquinone oxidoreductase subunit 5 [Hygroamblystegium varium var. humile]QKG04856.1 NADH-plastoquinone oxidoreductase subunit 5 [Hygroamblystegium varium var. humile]